LVFGAIGGGMRFAFPPYGSGFIYREIRVSILWSAVPAKVGGAENWMFAPSFVVEEQIVLCQGE
jgi:hypothetical protein